MMAPSGILLLFAVLLPCLACASCIGWVLQRRATTDQARETLRNLNERIRAWWVMVLIVGAAFLLGPYATLALFAVCSGLAMREFLRAARTDVGPGTQRAMFFFILLAQYGLIAAGWYGLFSIFIPVYGFLALLALSAAGQDCQVFLERNAKLHVGSMLCVYCLSHAPALLLLDIPHFSAQQNGANALLLLYLLLIVQLSDVFQYVFGKLWGKHKIAPLVSPSKTVEGWVGGGLSAVAVGTALHGMTPFTPWQAALMSMVIVLGGFLGGLALSAMKRGARIKDWGHTLKGHGGVLDRLDSVVFAAPLFFHLTRYFFT